MTQKPVSQTPPKTAKTNLRQTCQNCAHSEPYNKAIHCGLTKRHVNRLMTGCFFWTSAYIRTQNGP